MAKPPSVFAALADPTRRAILEGLRPGGQTAGTIASIFDVSWPAISRHLRILKTAGLVWETREGRTRYYEIKPEAFRAAITWLTQLQAHPIRSVTSPVPGPSLVGREYTS